MISALQNRKIAITGATGFVGYQVVKQLVDVGAHVTALVRPTSNRDRLNELRVKSQVAELNQPESVAHAIHGNEILIHAAGAVDFGEDWQRFREVNVGGTQGVIDGAKQAGIKRVIHVSSIVAVGGSIEPAVLDESASWNLGPLRVPYATTKREAEEVALAANSKNLEVLAVNPGCVLGPDDFTISEFGYLCRRFWRGKLPISFTGGNNFVDVRDVADGILRAITLGRPGERYLLTGENLRLSTFFSNLALVSHRSHPRVTLPAWMAPPLAHIAQRFEKNKPGKRPLLSVSQAKMLGMYFFFDAAKAKRELGFQPRPLADTIRDAHRFWTGSKAA